MSDKKKLYVLGMGCGHLASASELHLGQVGTRGSASVGLILPIPPFDWKKGVIPLFDHFPKNNFTLKVGEKHYP